MTYFAWSFVHRRQKSRIKDRKLAILTLGLVCNMLFTIHPYTIYVNNIKRMLANDVENVLIKEWGTQLWTNNWMIVSQYLSWYLMRDTFMKNQSDTRNLIVAAVSLCIIYDSDWLPEASLFNVEEFLIGWTH